MPAIAPRIFLLAMLSLLIASAATGKALAAGQVGIDHLVETVASPLVTGQTAKDYHSRVTITNISEQKILPPVRILVTSIDKARTGVANADGYFAGNPYVEINFPGALLKHDSVEATLVFERDAGRSTPGSSGNGKTKNPNSPTFEFTTSVTGGTEVAPQAPTSIPYVLTSGNVFNVAFSVGVLSDTGSVGDVYLRNLTFPDPDTLMNDDGINGDQVAGDDIYGVRLQVDAAAVAPGDCFSYAGVTSLNGDEIVSGVYRLCVTSFPPRIAPSDLDPGNLITLSDGHNVLGNELLIRFVDDASEDDIAGVIDGIDGEIVGTALLVGVHQVRLAQSLTPKRMENLIRQLNNNPLVVVAAANGLVAPSVAASDPQFVNQRGLKAIHVDDAWDASATGAGVTVIVLDEGVDGGHLDLAGKVVAGGANTDATGHGTQMAGIIAALADNIDVAGIARDAQIRSVFVDITTDAGLIQGFNDAAAVAGRIVNVSINKTSPAGGVPGLCESINNAIVAGTGKVVVNSAGNNSSDGAWWPGNCNSASADAFRFGVLGHPPSDVVADKSRFIVVSATDCNSDECPADTLRGTSNFGDWVDVAAPGNSVPTLLTGGGTTTISGTSASAAMVSAAAANLVGCGLALSDIEAALSSDTLGSSLVQVPYSGTAGSGNTPRIDMVIALETANTAPTDINLSASTIDELIDTSGGTAIGTLSSVDANACDSHGYSISGGADAAKFSIAGDQLLLDDGVLDFETTPSYSVNVTSTDFHGQSINETFVVNVNDLVEGNTFMIDFDTRQDGTPYTGLGDVFAANEYDGVTIQGNDPSPGVTSVDQVDAAANPDSAISGYHVRVGAFSSTPATQLDLGFITAVTSLSFDFGSPSGGITVEAFDASSASLGVFPFAGTGTFINQAGFPILTGNAALSGIGNISAVVIRPDLPNEGLIFDNLVFTTP